VPRPSPYIIRLTDAEEAALAAKARHRSSEHRVFIRYNAILMAARGMDNTSIAQRLGADRKTVSRWRKRFFEERIDGLEERPRSGRPRRFSP
jgi:transposase